MRASLLLIIIFLKGIGFVALSQQGLDTLKAKIETGQLVGCLNYHEIFKLGSDKDEVDALYSKILSVPPHQNQLISIQLSYAEAINRKGDKDKSIALLDNLADTIELCSDLEKSDYYSTLAVLSLASANPELAFKYTTKAIELMKDTTAYEIYQNKLMRHGVALNALNLNEDALTQFIRAEQLTPFITNSKNELYLKLNKAVAYINLDRLEEGKQFFLDAIELILSKDDYYALIRTYGNIADIYLTQDSLVEAEVYCFKAIDAAIAHEQHLDLYKLYNSLSEIYIRQKDYKKAYYAKVYSDSIDGIYNSSDILDNLTQLELKNINYHNQLEQELLAAKHEHDQLLSQSEITKRNYLIVLSIILTCSILTVLIIIFGRYRNAKKQKLLIESQKKIIDLEKKATEDSINYAQEIQAKLLQDWSIFRKTYPNSNLIYLPKDIVSGDFYWFETNNRATYLAVGDCTGHGVPGAFMTILSLNILSEISKENLTSCSAIMTRFNELLIDKLNVSEDVSNKFGLELSLCKISSDRKQLDFCGSRQRMLLVRNDGGREEYKGQKITFGKSAQAFEEQSIAINKGDFFFLYTDGMPDQKGDKTMKKLYYPPFNQLLSEVTNIPTNQCELHITNFLKNWKGKITQTDDITIVAVEI